VHRLRYTHSPSREQVSQHPSPSVRNGPLRYKIGPTSYAAGAVHV